VRANWDHLRQFAADDDESWRAEAACYGTDFDAWFPTGYDTRDNRDSINAAKRICRNCPAVNDCLLWALKRPAAHGIWGGTTPRERMVIRRRMNLEAMRKRVTA
jgi:WhiB family redox-sensing transcriptional regulator